MSKTHLIRTAESVSPRHPDKLCDQISDAVLDGYLAQDPRARVAIDVAGGHGTVFVTGEVTAHAEVDIPQIVRDVLGDTPEIIVRISQQSPEIAHGVDTGGAGDQGIMTGYACNETPEYLPLEYVLARNLNQWLYRIWPFDGKTQVTLRGTVIIAIVASFQHAPQQELRQAIQQWLQADTLATPAAQLDIHANPAGDWAVGGFDADAGLTGRKLAVDNYGPRIAIGGGAFSGKDPSKVDRSAAYMARHIAIDYLKRHNANEVFVTIAYAIGYPQPLQATVTIDGRTEQINGYDLTPAGIITALDLRRPQYRQRAMWGHFSLAPTGETRHTKA